MTTTTSPATVAAATAPPDTSKTWLDYRSVWRWHFYAGLFCIPFVLILATSGSIYLFKPQVEAWLDRSCDNLNLTAPPATPEEQIRAALTAVPESTFNAFEVPERPNDAVRIIVTAADGRDIRVYMHPQTLAIMKAVPEQDRFMRLIFRIHGELMIGNVGSYVVELAASWTIVMILTGLYLWWPRQTNGFGGIAYPRLGRGSRTFWRDVHSVTGVWISGLALVLLLSGLPWAKFWGDYFKRVRQWTGTAVVRQDWTNGSEACSTPISTTPTTNESETSGSPAVQTGEHSGHQMGGTARRNLRAFAPTDLSAVARIIETIKPLQLQPPVVISPPGGRERNWTAKSLTANRPQRVDLTLSESGTLLGRKDFGDRHVIDRISGTGIAAHEGQLFGWPNQLLGLVTAGGLILLCVSSIIMWWNRREVGVLGAPKIIRSRRTSFGLATIIILLALYLPLFGASLLLVRLIEKAILRRIPRVNEWLGLTPRLNHSS